MPDEEKISNAPALNPDEVVVIPYSLFQSFLGIYYIGRTPGLFIRNGCNCWGGVVNPRDSDADIFIDSISVSNTSASPVCTRIWINAASLGNVFISSFVTPANTAAGPIIYPRAQLCYAQDLPSTPQDGTSLASRFIGPFTTQTEEFGGRLIIRPGGSCILFCYARDIAQKGQAYCQTCEISMHWWEQQIAG